MEEYEIHPVGVILDSNTSADEQTKITAFTERKHSVALDLDDCSYVSSAGSRVMFYALKSTRAKDKNIRLVGVS